MKRSNRIKIISLMALTAVIITASFFHRPIYLKYYEWKEPYFINPLKQDIDTLVIRNDDYGEGHFGAKRRGGRRHNGIDILADMGSVVCAARSGEAICGDQPRGMGRYVKIIHPNGFSTTYGHLKDWSIPHKVKVRQGQPIGLVGKTGNANIAAMHTHLHFEIRNGGEPVNPLSGLMETDKHEIEEN
jgi:murein DD-endopeptidase MepM/ murein hydrolase activator NlpD